MSEGFQFFESPEQLAEHLRSLQEREQMGNQSFSLAWKRLVTAELDKDQLEVLVSVMRVIQAAEDPEAAANYFEGFMSGAIAVRFPDDDLDPSAVGHEFASSEDLDNPYCNSCGLPPANAVHHQKKG